jgi:hypothetical protein
MYLKIDRNFDSLRSNPPKQPVNTPGLFIFVNVQILNYVGTVVARNKFAAPHRHTIKPSHKMRNTKAKSP